MQGLYKAEVSQWVCSKWRVRCPLVQSRDTKFPVLGLRSWDGFHSWNYWMWDILYDLMRFLYLRNCSVWAQPTLEGCISLQWLSEFKCPALTHDPVKKRLISPICLHILVWAQLWLHVKALVPRHWLATAGGTHEGLSCAYTTPVVGLQTAHNVST